MTEQEMLQKIMSLGYEYSETDYSVAFLKDGKPRYKNTGSPKLEMISMAYECLVGEEPPVPTEPPKPEIKATPPVQKKERVLSAGEAKGAVGANISQIVGNKGLGAEE